MQLNRNTSYLRKSHFCAKSYYRFLAVIFYILKKIPRKNHARFWKWNIKRTLQSALRLVFEKIKFKVLQYIQHVSIVNAKGSVKIRLACSKAFIPTILSFNIVTHSDGYIKSDKYLFFIKLVAANALLK